MSTLREQFQEDLKTIFFNPDEFAEMRTIDGREMLVVEDSDLLEQRRSTARYADNVYTAQTLIFVRASDFGPKPRIDAMLRLDGKMYRVLSASGKDVYEIMLGAVRG